MKLHIQQQKAKRPRSEHFKRRWPAPKPTIAEKARQSLWLLVLEGLAILVTIGSIWFLIRETSLASEAREAEAHARKVEALARNWQILTTPAPGNSGKVEALEYLASQGQSLRGIDISCKAMGGIEVDESGVKRCKREPYLRGLNLSEEKLGFKVELQGADLSGALLSGANLSGADLWEADLSGARLWEADLSGANLNGASFSNATDIRTSSFENAWAWADSPPIGLPSDIDIQLCQYDQNQHRRFEKPDPCIPPRGVTLTRGSTPTK